MEKFIEVCESYYGSPSCIYHYINPNQVMSFCIVRSEKSKTIELKLVDGRYMVLLHKTDLKVFVEEEDAERIMRAIEDEEDWT